MANQTYPSSPDSSRNGSSRPAAAKPPGGSANVASTRLPVLGNPSEAVTPLCAQCAAMCCRYIALPIDNPETAAEFDNVRWYLMHENIHVFVEEDQWYIGIATRCKHLGADNLCGIYETRPRICRKYTTDNCEWHGGEYEYDHLFTSAEQLRKFADRTLGKSMLYKPRPRKAGGDKPHPKKDPRAWLLRRVQSP